MVPRQPKFEGRCEELKGHIYDCSDARQSDIFAKTTKEIAVYVGRTYKYGSDAGLAVEKLVLPTIMLPEDPAEPRHTRVTLELKQDGPVSSSWILLDNCSTIDVFHNGELLENIRSG